MGIESTSKVLIIKPSALGDIVHSLPFLAALKRQWPDTRVHWVVARGLHTLLEGHPDIERLWVIDKSRWKRLNHIGTTMGELRSLFSGLKAERFDVAVDLQGLFRSGLIAWGSGARSRFGFAEAREGSTFFYTEKVKGGISQDVHAIDRHMRMASALGCEDLTREFRFPALPDISGFGLPDEYAVIAPSAGKRANRWPSERFGRVAAGLPVPSVVLSSIADERIADEVVSHSDGKAISLAGKTSLKEMAAVVKGARLMLSNDTGPMHFAAAFNVPVVAVFGPANPSRTGPYGEGHTVVKEDLPCAPCYAKKRCDDPVCLTNITVGRVLDAALEKLG